MCASCHRRPTFLPARPNDVDAAIMSLRPSPNKNDVDAAIASLARNTAARYVLVTPSHECEVVPLSSPALVVWRFRARSPATHGVDAATMYLGLRERGIHAVSTGGRAPVGTAGAYVI